MTRIDLGINGFAEVQGRMQELLERGSTDRVYVTGTNTEYAIYLEMGTRDMPPYPWFRPAVVEFQANPEQFIRKNTDYKSIDAIPTADALVEAIAVGLQTQMEANASAASSGSRSPGTHPDHPKRETGNLVASINATRVR